MTTALRTNHIQDEYERPVPGASVYVYNADGSLASLTSNGTTSIANPLTSDAFGNYSYYALVGYYREDVWFGGKLRWSENNVAVGSPGADLTLRANLQAWGLLTLTPQQDGAKGDGATNDNAAFVSALSSLGSSEMFGFGYGRGVAPLDVPAATSLYNMGTTPIEPNDTLRLSGQGTGMAGGWVSALSWGAGSHGIRLQHYNTTGDTSTYTPTVTRGGQASIISGLALKGGYSSTEGEFHGIFLRATASLRDLNIWNFEGDGIHIHADSQQPEAGNANCAEINSVWIQNTRDGVRIDGGDANQGYSLQLKVSGARRWGVYDERAWLHMGPLTQLCGFSGGDGTTAAKAVSAVANVAETHRFAVIAGREVQASTNAPPVTAVDDLNYYYFEDGASAVGLPKWFNGINLRAGGSYRLVNGGVILNGYHEGSQPPAQLGPGVLRLGGTWPTNSVRGGASILASANQVEINDLRITAGGVSFDDDQTGVVMIGRYSSGDHSAYLKCSSAASALILRAPDNSNGIEVSNAAIAIDKPLAATGAITTSGGSVGYATGAGAAVTQITSRTTTTPAINKPCGQITLFSAAGSATWQTFTVANTTVAATDVIRVIQASGTDKYMIHVTKVVAATSFDITFATTGGTTTEQPVFNFAVIKAVAA